MRVQQGFYRKPASMSEPNCSIGALNFIFEASVKPLYFAEPTLNGRAAGAKQEL